MLLLATWAPQGTDILLRVVGFVARQHQVLGLAMLTGMVKFPAGSLRPGALTIIAEESPSHH